MGASDQTEAESDFAQLSGAPLTPYENRKLRAMLKQIEHESWLKKRLKVLWPYVVALMGGVVWAIDAVPKFLKH